MWIKHQKHEQQHQQQQIECGEELNWIKLNEEWGKGI